MAKEISLITWRNNPSAWNAICLFAMICLPLSMLIMFRLRIRVQSIDYIARKVYTSIYRHPTEYSGRRSHFARLGGL